ncbi:MAG TPA: diacylglycerol kinase family protein [Chitinophagaceae bacterium]|nr:diacylglycerol kinase family protein [Chitinophagaceae bacterium]
MKNQDFSPGSRLSSFGHAFSGIQKFFQEEPNARIHLLATVVVLILAAYLNASRIEWILLTIVIGMVWAAEIFNTAIERIMDFISPHIDPKVKLIKDMSAAAVLVCAVLAAAVGLIIFIPKII